jgi:hypothetical protein
MSLNWDLTKCPAWKATGKKSEEGKPLHAMHLPDGTEIPWGITNALIWATMGIGLGWDIGKKLDEFVFRIEAYQRVFGALCHKDGEDLWVTPAQVRAHAGMSTNVSTKTRRQFLFDMTKVIERDAEYAIRPEEKASTPET